MLKIWEVIYPLILYYVVMVLVMFLAQGVLGMDEAHYMTCQIIASLVTIPFIYQIYRTDKLKSGTTIKAKEPCNIMYIIVIMPCVAISLNNLILMSPLVSASDGFAEANRNFYGSTLGIELIGAAFITPILEELLHRGVIYKRLRQMAGIMPSVLISSLLFAFLHFNFVQFIYAFLLGIVLALFMEKTGHVYGAMIAHIIANTIAILRTEIGFLENLIDKSMFAWGWSIVLFVLGVGLLIIYLRQKNLAEKE